MKKAVLMLSGGPDSTTLAYWLKSEGYEIHTITFNFGEKEGEAEQRTANYFAKKISTSHRFVDFVKPFRDLYMSDDPIHILRKVETIQGNFNDIKPFGAGVAISLAASYAAEIGANDLFYAVHKDDAIYRENNEEFFSTLSNAISQETGKTFKVNTPFLTKSKAEVFKLGFDLGVPIEETWSCAANSSVHCGVCEPCQDRRDAIKSTKKEDKTLYTDQLDLQTNYITHS